MNYEIRGLQPGDLGELTFNMRAADVKELYAASGSLDMLHLLGLSVGASAAVRVGVGDGKPGVIYGIRPNIGMESAAVWLVATIGIRRYSVPFLKHSRTTIQEWFEMYPKVQTMFNFTHAENSVHHRWLEWCGATLLPPVPYGPLGELFIPFKIERADYV